MRRLSSNQEKRGRSFYLMQMPHQVPTLQLVADRTVGSPASTEEKSTVKAAVPRTLWNQKWERSKLPPTWVYCA